MDNTPRTFVGATTLHVDGLTSRPDQEAVADQITGIPGVTAVHIDAVNGTVTVTAGTPVDRVEVAAAVRSAGHRSRP